MDRVSIRVPATTANLGPGFDALGMALDIYNTVTVARSEAFGITISGEGAEALSHEGDNRVYQGVVAFYQHIGKPIPRLSILCENEIPLKRGLGSSAAAVVGGLVAANLLCGEPLPLEELLQMGAKLEGHPDNVAPALFGGCQVVVAEGGRVVAAPIPLPPGLRAVLFIPDFEMATERARSLLPGKVERGDAVYNIGRVALLVAGLATGRLQHLRVATQDRLHQPQRQALFPTMEEIFQGALSAGALGVFLSGGGSTVLALARGGEEAIARAMAKAAEGAGVSGRTKITRPSPLGAHRSD